MIKFKPSVVAKRAPYGQLAIEVTDTRGWTSVFKNPADAYNHLAKQTDKSLARDLVVDATTALMALTMGA